MGGVAAAFVATAGFAAACGGSTGNSAAPTPAATDYVTCLRDNGVNLPTARPSGRPSGFPTARGSNRPTVRPSGSGGFPRGGGGFFGGTAAPNGVDPSTWAKAQQACAALRPTAFPGRGRGGFDTAYRNCLSQHGVNISGPLNRLDTADPQVAAAEKICAVLRPSATPSS